jgi:endonuclease YncB( thermonuclease family)
MILPRNLCLKTAVLLMLALAAAAPCAARAAAKTNTLTGTVNQVVDGDTFTLADGQTVRCLGVDAPEKGDAYADEATQALNQLVGGKEVRLEIGSPAKDRDGRLLAYVFQGETLVNEEILRCGCACLRRPVASKHKKSLVAAQDEARKAARGIWTKAAEVSLAVSGMQAKSPTSGSKNLNEEFVVLENQGKRDINMTGWTLSDESHHRYLFPNFVLPAKSKVTIHTGLGSNTAMDLFWGNRVAIWNDDGDTVFIRDTEGHLILAHIY